MGLQGDRISDHGVNIGGEGLVFPCLYTPDGRVSEIVPYRGTLRQEQVRQAIGGAYQIITVGDNYMALSTGGAYLPYNPVVSDLVERGCYGNALIGHRSFFTGGA